MSTPRKRSSESDPRSLPSTPSPPSPPAVISVEDETRSDNTDPNRRKLHQKIFGPLEGLLAKLQGKSYDIEKAQAPNVMDRQRRRREAATRAPSWLMQDLPDDESEMSFHPITRLPKFSPTSSITLVHGDRGRRMSTWSVMYEVEIIPPVPGQEFSSESLYEEDEGIFDKLHYGVRRFIARHMKKIKLSVIVLLVIGFFVFLAVAIYLRERESANEKYIFNYCNGVGFLIIVTSIIVWFLSYYHFICPAYKKWIKKHLLSTLSNIQECLNDKTVRKILYGMTSLVFIVFLIFDGLENNSKLRCSGGVVLYVFLGYIFSKHPSRVQWPIVFWGLVLQYTFAMLILYWGLGDTLIKCISTKVKDFVEISNEGSHLIFAYLVNGLNQTVNLTYTFKEDNHTSGHHTIEIKGIVYIPWVVGFRMVPAILFFSCILSIFFYYGLLQWFVIKIAWLLQITMGTTAAESINAAATIFLGCTEAPLIIRPFLANMTKSELHAILTTGFATIAGTMLAVYVAFGLDPKHLLSATIMSAPAALAYAKLFYPETEVSTTTVKEIKLHKIPGKESNVFAAAAKGTKNAIPLVSTIIATLITFISLLKLVNVIVMWFGSLVGYPGLTLELIMGKFFIPCAFFMGIDGLEHCATVGELIGLKTTISEFVAYEQLKIYVKEGKITKREGVISVYALCGFSNLSAVGMQLGTLGALAPQRMDDMAGVMVRAFIAGSVTCFLTACIAGSLLSIEDDRP